MQEIYAKNAAFASAFRAEGGRQNAETGELRLASQGFILASQWRKSD